MTAPSQSRSGRGVAVVTGAGSGIGRALAQHAAQDGYDVALADINVESLEELAVELASTGVQVTFQQVDVSQHASVQSFADRVHETYGPATLLFNNAGIETTGLLWEIDPERWNRALSVNVSGVFYGIRAFVPNMISNPTPSRVVNLSSVGGLSVGPFQSPYIASKHAVLALTECLNEELQIMAPHVSASVVLPGPVNTAIFRSDAAGATSGEQHRSEMAGYLQQEGISAETAAEIVFAGISAGDLWIHTHPGMSDQMIRSRAANLLSGTAPSTTKQEVER